MSGSFAGRSERGASLVEYALLVALLIAVVVVGARTLGERVEGVFTVTAEEINGGGALGGP